VPHSRWANSRCDWDHGDISACKGWKQAIHHNQMALRCSKKLAFLLCRGFRLSGASVFAECAQHVHCTVMVSHAMQVGKMAFQATHSYTWNPRGRDSGLAHLTGHRSLHMEHLAVWLHPDSTRFDPRFPHFFGDPPADPLGTQCSMCRLFRRGRLEDQPAGNLCDRSKVIKLGKTTGNHRKPSKSP
jgi:hypothetical protein